MPAQGKPVVTLLLRHGQTPMSVQKRYAGRSDVPLTETGLAQAAAAAKRLASAGIDVIVTSPLQRTVQTAEVVAAVTGLPVTTDDGFRETDFGDWDGLTIRRGTGALAVGDDRMAGRPGRSRRPEARASPRSASASLPRWHRVLAGQAGKRILIVSHVTPIKTLVAAALLAPPPALFRMHLDVAALSEIDWYADGPAVLRSFNDTAHLRRLPGATSPAQRTEPSTA